MNRYPRDLHGYGATPPNPQWPNGARIAVQFVMNYEEGGENNILHGDAASEAFLAEVVSAQPWPGQRHWNIETMYEYGARVGFWRLHRLFTEAEIPITVYAVGTALERTLARACGRDVPCLSAVRLVRPSRERASSWMKSTVARRCNGLQSQGSDSS